MNIYDIANAAGVSIATVSRVLNDGVVGKDTREKVLRVMQEMGYTPNAFARGLGLGTMNTVGVVVSNIHDLYFAHALSVLEKKLRARGYDMILCCVGGGAAERKKYFDLLLAKHVDAVILIGSRFAARTTLPLVREMARRVPVICMGGELNIPRAYSVVCDDKAVVAAAVKTLYEKGYRSFLYLYDTVSPSGINKRKGFVQGLTQCGLDPHSAPSIRCERDIDRASAAIAQVFRQGARPDAIITAEDELAVGVLQFAAQKGLRVPQELAIVGYNNSILSRATQPQLSSVDNKVATMSEMAVQLLAGIFEDQNSPGKVTVQAQLVQRGTS